MALNCIVDDSALLAGLGDKAKYNLEKWIADGAINAFVPLHTLERLSTLRDSSTDRCDDAQRALQWLDTLTSQTYKKTAGRVQLQGPDDQYTSWREVENYILPDTPLSSHDGAGDLSRTFERDLSLTKARNHPGADSPSQVTKPVNGSIGGAQGHKGKHWRRKSGSPSSIPQRVRPLINFVVWRSHHEDTDLADPGHYILLTDDTNTQRQAQKFGIRAKGMSQVSSIVARKTSQRVITTPPPAEVQQEDDDDIGLPPDERPPQEDAEDEILFDPSKRPRSSRGLDVLDPNQFSRRPLKNNAAVPPSPVQAPRALPANETKKTPRSRGNSGRGGRGQGSPRGASNAAKASNGPSTPTSPTQKARTRPATTSPPTVPILSKPIDPDSYARNLPGSRGRGRGRGQAANRGRLWEPT